jgi:hypothetical protein
LLVATAATHTTAITITTQPLSPSPASALEVIIISIMNIFPEAGMIVDDNNNNNIKGENVLLTTGYRVLKSLVN